MIRPAVIGFGLGILTAVSFLATLFVMQPVPLRFALHPAALECLPPDMDEQDAVWIDAAERAMFQQYATGSVTR